MQTLDLQYIKNRRIELEKTLQEMADSLGMKNASTYLKYENGTYAFKAEQLPMLSKTLKCKIPDFFNRNVAKTAI
ncbi:helix-turn-helix domain-containing protein [Bacillus sp. FSL K6-3431]|uniref:helix-turn-helix domain-containing protein n=1 Tax=Bacillus sp. FSL K6-3431 TaxID=2921500 RepID=UPI0030F504B8